LSWTYDGFGNRLAQNVTKGTAPVVSLSINASTNRITTSGFAYDAAGNLVQWPGGTVTMGAEYDVDGRLTRVTHDGWPAIRYYYDARNRRVRRGEDWTARLELYGLGGELLGVYGPSTSWPVLLEERVYFAGRLVEHYNPRAYPWQSPTRDRLGSRPVARRYPFGEGNNADNDEFATYRKDTTAQHYYAWHRFYSATWGRFSSPDPYVLSGGLTNPQGWNRYSYVANDPVNYYDPHGLWQVAPITSFPIFAPPSSVTVTAPFPTLTYAPPGAPDLMGMGVARFWDDSDGELRMPEDWGGASTEQGLIRNKKEAKSALQAALAWLSEDCFRKLGISRSAAMDKAQQIVFFDGRVTEDGSSNIVSLLGPEIDVSNNATFRSVSAYQRAVILPLKSGDLSKYLVLGGSFFDEDQSRIDQYVTLAHESFHYALNMRDTDLARHAGYRGRSTTQASAAFSKWLKEGCK
jgi:RHS repeat-associated protein